MITSINNFLLETQLIVNFFANSTIFLSAFYIALHNRTIPRSYITPLWYIGMFAGLTSITIICEWVFGPSFELSYWSIGTLSETASNILIAIMAGIMLMQTVKTDIVESKKRY